MGKLIVIEGLDGSGKATQTQMLADELSKTGKIVSKISFPDYDSDSSALVKMYLNRELGEMDQISPYGASLFYTVDRYASYLKSWKEVYDTADIIVADRYTTSNIPFQMSKLPKDEWRDYLAWLEEIEYDKLKLPKPDKVIFLDVDPEVSYKLLLQRYHGDKSKLDMHEQDIRYQLRCREAALFGARVLGWSIITCSISNASMRTSVDISRMIWAAIPPTILRS